MFNRKKKEEQKKKERAALQKALKEALAKVQSDFRDIKDKNDPSERFMDLQSLKETLATKDQEQTASANEIAMQHFNKVQNIFRVTGMSSLGTMVLGMVLLPVDGGITAATSMVTFLGSFIGLEQRAGRKKALRLFDEYQNDVQEFVDGLKALSTEVDQQIDIEIDQNFKEIMRSDVFEKITNDYPDLAVQFSKRAARDMTQSEKPRYELPKSGQKPPKPNTR